MYEILSVGGHVGGECFLVVAEQSAVLLDAGFDFCAPATVDNIRRALGSRPLDYILVSHSHYDHIGGVPAIKNSFPAAKVVGSRYAREVVARPGARAVMRSLNDGCAREAGVREYPDRIDELSIDVALADGDLLRLPDMTIRALSTPGHTRCAMSYYFLEERLLACSETFGISPRYPEVIPCFIVSYHGVLDAIRRARALEPGQVFLSHTGLIPQGDTGLFFDNAQRAAERMADMLVEMNGRGRTGDDMLAAFKREFYLPAAEMQPEQAFVLNTRAMIPRILEELGKAPQKTA